MAAGIGIELGVVMETAALIIACVAFMGWLTSMHIQRAQLNDLERRHGDLSRDFFNWCCRVQRSDEKIKEFKEVLKKWCE